MSISDLINILKNYEGSMQILLKESNENFSFLECNNFSTNKLYPDLDNKDNSTNQTGELETYLIISKHF